MPSQIVLITGVSGGLGIELALAFANRGDIVLGVYHQNHIAITKLEENIKRIGGFCQFYQCDIRQEKEVKKLFLAIASRWGKLDGLINNAGIIRDQNILKMSYEDWDEVIQVNLTGSFFCLKEAISLLTKEQLKKSKFIINIVSLRGLTGNEGQTNYSASKAGLIALTQTAALELNPFGIKVNAVIPGLLETQMSKGSKALKDFSERLPSDIAQWIVKIASLQETTGQLFILENRVTKYANLPISFSSCNYGDGNFNSDWN